MIDLNCTGTEDSVWNCLYNGLIDYYSCPHKHDASIICQSLYINMLFQFYWILDINTPMDNCNDGDIRLSGGNTQYEGKVEVCINRVWGGICSPGWGSFDSRVVCRQLGHLESG